ncbi:MAG: hypothetical protein GY817_02355 [bacterium]|nr:hypothetical protein [bacterium]
MTIRKIFFLFVFSFATGYLFSEIRNESKYSARIDQFFDQYYSGFDYLADVEVGSNIKIILSIDEHKFLEQDINFIKSVIFMQLGLDKQDGDTVKILQIPFSEHFVIEKTGKGILENKVYVFAIGFGLVILLIFSVVIVLFLIFMVNMNRRLEQLIMANRELAKKNILLAPESVINSDHNISASTIEESSFFNDTNEQIVVDRVGSDISGVLEKIAELDRKRSKLNADQKVKKIKFIDLVQLSPKLLFEILKQHNEHILGVAFLGLKPEVLDKFFDALSEDRKLYIKKELKKNQDLNSISAEAVLQMQSKIVRDVNLMISEGKIDHTLFIN